MRTDSTRVSDTAINQSKDYIIEHFGKEYLGKKKAAKKKADTQDAHEAIRPTSVTHDPESLKSKLTNDQYRLYKLIYERLLASKMAPAIMEQIPIYKINNN